MGADVHGSEVNIQCQNNFVYFKVAVADFEVDKVVLALYIHLASIELGMPGVYEVRERAFSEVIQRAFASNAQDADSPRSRILG